MDPHRARALELLETHVGRGALKRLATEIDLQPELRAAVIALARERGVDLPDDATGWSGKRLLRRARQREAEARTRTNPIARDEDFVCAHCGTEVQRHGRTARDHCPRCLRSLHVDRIPGDRAETCRGILDPTGIQRQGERIVVVYACRSCGAIRRNQAILDGDSPDDWDAIVALSVAR